MLARFRHFIAPPAFADTEKSRTAHLLNTILLWMAALQGGVFLVLVTTVGTGVVVSGLVALGTLWYLAFKVALNRGYVFTISRVLIIALLVVLTILPAIGAGIKETTIPGYVLMTIIAGLLLKRPIMWRVMAVTMGATTGFFLAEATGVWQPGLNNFTSPLAVWVVNLIFIIFITICVDLATSSLGQALRDARLNQGRLQGLNEALLREIEERKRAEAALAQEQNLLRTIIDTIPDPIFVKDINGRYILVNQVFVQNLLQPGVSSILGKRTQDLYAEAQEIQTIDREFQKVMAGEHILNHVRQMPDLRRGMQIWCSVSKSPLRDANGKVIGMVGISRDINHQKQVELALRDERNLLRTLLNNLPDQVHFKDIQRRLVLINRATERAWHDAYGRSAADVLGKTHEELLGEVLVNEHKLFAGEIDSYWESHHLRSGQPTESWVVVGEFAMRDDAGALLGAVGIIHDITDIKRAEQALEHERNLLRTLIDAVPEAIYIKDAEARYMDCNARQIFISGRRTTEDLIGKTDRELFPLLGPEYYEDERWVLSTGVPIINKEEVAGEKIGQVRTHRTTRVPLRNSDDQIIGLVGISIDITEQKLIENEIHRLNDELEQRVIARTRQLEASNKELESFAYTVSHDLRAPLRSIDGFSQILLEDHAASLGAAASEYLKRIRAATQRMDQLIDGLLRLSRVMRSPLSISTVDVTAMAQDVAQELQATDPARHITWKIAPRLVAQGDEILLRVALHNLLHNAWKFTSKVEQAEIRVGSVKRHESEWYFVQDNGVGFDMAYVNKLFGPFQRLHPVTEFEGTGIGLATVARVIRRHGGEIAAEANPGQGATFYFKLN
jgi:PAS domain S-box-containing protein